jgi:hypothetical protein
MRCVRLRARIEKTLPPLKRRGKCTRMRADNKGLKFLGFNVVLPTILNFTGQIVILVFNIK